MTWINANVGRNGNETTKIVNVEDALAIIPSMNGSTIDVSLEKKGGLTQSPFLIFRGKTDAFTAYMKKLKKSLPPPWVESLEGYLVNTSAAVGIETRLVGGQYEVIADFELDKSRSLFRNLFRSADELLFTAYMDKLRKALPPPWVETLEGYLVNIATAVGIETRLRGGQYELIADFESQEFIIFQKEKETELKAFMDDLTPALMSGLDQ